MRFFPDLTDKLFQITLHVFFSNTQHYRNKTSNAPTAYENVEDFPTRRSIRSIRFTLLYLGSSDTFFIDQIGPFEWLSALIFVFITLLLIMIRSWYFYIITDSGYLHNSFERCCFFFLRPLDCKIILLCTYIFMLFYY